MTINVNGISTSVTSPTWEYGYKKWSTAKGIPLAPLLLGGATASVTLADGAPIACLVSVPEAATITGVAFAIDVNGSYTADNNNKVGLYSISGGVLTLVASSANTANLWQPGSTGSKTQAFSATYAAAPGVYAVIGLYNNSAQVTAPALRGHSITGSLQTLSNANSLAPGLSWTGAAQNDLPSSITASVSQAATSSIPTFTLY